MVTNLPMSTRADRSPATDSLAIEPVSAGERNPWSQACQDFLAAVPDEMRDHVEQSLRCLHNGAVGLRRWVARIATGEARVPELIPAELVRVYLADSEAVPLHDCENCGIAIPVRPHPLRGFEGEPDQIYFPSCPVCGGRTGWYLFWSRQAEGKRVSDTLRRSRPR
jgi:hypothetical protein